ncbi:MAG: hypothetical protein QGD94_08080, partial [Planctomycetia bacterium]|nr:hypothetical protein [Planctomycetia bacterium]
MEAHPARVRLLFPFAVPVSHVAVFCDPNHPQRLSPNVVVDYLRMDTGEEVVYDVAGTKRNIDDTFFIIRFKKPIMTTELRLHQLSGINCWTEIEAYGPLNDGGTIESGSGTIDFGD